MFVGGVTGFEAMVCFLVFGAPNDFYTYIQCSCTPQVVFTPYFLKKCSRGASLTSTTCPKTVVGVSKGMLPVEYFCFTTFISLCHLNFMELKGLPHT